MKKKNDTINETTDIPEVEAVVAEPILDGSEEVEPIALDDAPLSDEPAEAPAAEVAAAEDAVDDAVIAEPLAVENETPAPAPAEEKPAPGYGAPQMLYEDFIPFEYLHASDAKEEKPAEEPKPKKEKAKKPTKEDAILAEVEAEMASREAESVPEESLPADDAVIKEVPVEQGEIVPIVVAEEEPVQEEAVMAKKKERAPEEQPRKYSSYEKKLRRKYKMDKDVLLNSNDIIPGFILAKGENVVRSYNCLASKKGDGTLCLTNKRLMINTDERSEVAVNMVTGIKFARNTYFSFVKFLFGFLFLVLGAAMILLPFFRDKVPVIPFVTDDHWKDWFKYLFIACGAVSVLIGLPLWGTMVKKYFYFTVFVNEGAPFLECKSKSFVKSEKKGKQYSFVVTDAGKESEKAARELGALILEVKEGRYDF